MSLAESIERKALFTITRVVAFFCVSIFFLVVVSALIYGLSVWQADTSTTVTPQEIIDQVKPVALPAEPASALAGQQPPKNQSEQLSPLYGYRIPFALQKYLSGDNPQIIRNHLDDVPAADRQAYIDDLGKVVTAAEANKVEVADAINAYMKLKADRYAAANLAAVRKFEKLKTVAIAVAAGLLLIALFSLVLVLLAIERNTRPIRREALAPSEATRSVEAI